MKSIYLNSSNDLFYDFIDFSLTSIDDIERKTGLDFMSLLEDSQENDLESQIADKLW